MANIKSEASHESMRAKAFTICCIVAGRLGYKGWEIFPDTAFEDLGASTSSIEDIVKQVSLTFDISFDEDTKTVAESIDYVNDLIEKVVGISFYGQNLCAEENDVKEQDDSEEDDDAEDAVYTNEQEYFCLYQEYLEDYDYNIGPRERKRLEKERVRLSITKERAQEIEDKILLVTEEENEYLEEYREYFVDYNGEIGPHERKRLERIRTRLGISEERATEIELKGVR